MHAYAPQGLRLIEVDKADLTDLPDIVDVVAGRPEKFIIYCDDLSFEEGEPGYKAMKSILDGSVGRRHAQRAGLRHQQPPPPAARVHDATTSASKHTPDGEMHPGEVVEEKISLSERFGLWVSFYPFSQEEYLAHRWPSGCGPGRWTDEAIAGRTSPRPWSGRWSVARAAAAWPSSLRATTPAATKSARHPTHCGCRGPDRRRAKI